MMSSLFSSCTANISSDIVIAGLITVAVVYALYRGSVINLRSRLFDMRAKGTDQNGRRKVSLYCTQQS